MQVHYYEAMAMLPQATPDRGCVRLNDHHQSAWALFAKGAPDWRASEARPFLFRVQPHPTLPMDVYLLRAPVAFAGARPRSVDLGEGRVLAASWLHLPSSSRLDTEPGSGPTAGTGRGKRYQPSIEAWPENCRDKIRRHGFEVDGKMAVHKHGVFRFPGKRGRRIGIAHCRATLVVTNPERAAEAWLRGVSRKRGYGLGLLMLDTTGDHHA